VIAVLAVATRYTQLVDREDLRNFARRDRAPVDALRAAYWADLGRTAGATALLAVADALRREVQSTRSDWPSLEERLADHESHARVSLALQRVRIKLDR
jgi:hypothetical protein